LDDSVEKFQTTDEKFVIVKGIAKVDERPEIILAWWMHYNSNERVAAHVEWSGHTKRQCVFDYSCHTCHVSAVAKAPPPLSNRRFSARQIWKKGLKGNDGIYIIAMMPDKTGHVDNVDTSTTNTATDKSIPATTTAFLVLKPLAARVTQITLVQQTDLNLGNNFVGKAINNYAAKYSLAVLDDLLVKYQRKGIDVDEEIREFFIKRIEIAPPISEDGLNETQISKDLLAEYEDDNHVAEVLLKKTVSFRIDVLKEK
jgi:hypothetical protein